MKIDKSIFFIFGVATLCMVLAVIAGKAKAGEQQNLAITTGSQIDAYQDTVKHDPIKSTIVKQLAAIKARNAGEAFSLTTESIHNKYKNAKNFLGHMRFEFRTLYNHTDFTFLDRHDMNGSLIQKVQVLTPHNDPVLVIFKLEKTESGSWLIDSFTVIGGGDTQPI